MFDFDKVLKSVALDARDTEGAYNAEIEAAYTLAQIDLGRENFFTNELRGMPYPLKKGCSVYFDEGDCNRPDLYLNDIYKINLDFNNVLIPIQKVRPGETDLFARDDPPGPPMWWEYYGNSLKFFPCPDRDYDIYIYANSFRRNTGKDYIYEDDLFPYMYFLTKYYFATNSLQDENMAQIALNGVQKQKADLTRMTEQRKGTGLIASNW